MRTPLKAFLLSLSITIACTLVLFSIVNAPTEIREPDLWYMQMTCDMFIFNGTHYVYNETLYGKIDVKIRHMDINETYATVIVEINSTGLKVLELVVNKGKQHRDHRKTCNRI